MDDYRKLPTVRPRSKAQPTTNQPLPESERRAFLAMAARAIGAAFHSGSTNALLKPALKNLAEATSYEVGLARFHKEASAAFADALEPAMEEPGGEYLARIDINRSVNDILGSIRTSVDAMSERLLSFAQRSNATEITMMAVNNRTHVHLDLLHLELLWTTQRLAMDQQSGDAQRAFLDALGAFLDRARNSYLLD